MYHLEYTITSEACLTPHYVFVAALTWSRFIVMFYVILVLILSKVIVMSKFIIGLMWDQTVVTQWCLLAMTADLLGRHVAQQCFPTMVIIGTHFGKMEIAGYYCCATIEVVRTLCWITMKVVGTHFVQQCNATMACILWVDRHGQPIW